jgi:carbon storage regulator
MLVLSRNIGEVVRIGDNIEVTVVAVNGHQVRLGINAPREVVVEREEIANRKQHECATSRLAENGAITTALAVTVGLCRSSLSSSDCLGGSPEDR